MGRNEEGSRAVEFLQGDPEDRHPVLGPAFDLHHPHRGYGHPLDVACAAPVEDRWVGVGCDFPAGGVGVVSYFVPGMSFFGFLGGEGWMLIFRVFLDRAQPVVDGVLVLSAAFSLPVSLSACFSASPFRFTVCLLSTRTLRTTTRSLFSLFSYHIDIDCNHIHTYAYAYAYRIYAHTLFRTC